MTSETYLPRIGGAEVHVENLRNQLVARGHEVTLLTNEVGESMPGVVRIPWSKQNAWTLFIRLITLSKGVDLIHAHYCHRLALLVSIIGRVRRVPVFITLHGMGILDHPGASRIAQFWHGFYRYWSLQLCTHVISTSDDLALVADRYISRDKMTIVFNGYNEKMFYPRDRIKAKEKLALVGKKIIMTVRRLVPKNGPHYLIEAMPKILQQLPDVMYVVVGDGPLKSMMERRVQELGIEHHVMFLGMQQNDTVPELIAAADVIVFPSTAESSSIACAEAMAMEKPIVASRVGGLVELLGKKEERGWLVDLVPWTGSNYDAPTSLPIESYERLASSVVSALLDAESQKSNQARSFAQAELSWNAVTTKTLRVYTRFTS